MFRVDFYDPIKALLGAWSGQINVWSALFRIVLSVLFAAVIGWERSTKRHAAGLRTFILVSLAATTAMLLDGMLIGGAGVSFPALSTAAIVAVAVLSSNSVLYSSRNQIKGLTTSAGLWTCTLLGLCAGAGLYTVTLIVFLAVLVTLLVFPSLEKSFKNRSNHFEVHLELTSKSALGDFISTIRKLGLKIDDIESNPAYANSGLSVYSVSITIRSDELKQYQSHAEIIDALRTLEYVHYIEEMA